MNDIEPDLSAYDFDLPDDRIALRPHEPRDACKLLLMQGNDVEDIRFHDVLDILRAGDLLIGNDTKVLPALLFGIRYARTEDGHDIDVQVNLLERIKPCEWLCLCKPARRLKVGDRVHFGDVLEAQVEEKLLSGRVRIRFDVPSEAQFWSGIDEVGRMPIPPYIAKQRASDEADASDYQTVFAREEGSVAAPTAGLHFTPELLEALGNKRVDFKTVTLHVGAGTFAGLTQDNLDKGELHSEYYEVPEDTMIALAKAKAEGRRVIAIGTTALRTLETIAGQISERKAVSGLTNIFIQPGYSFQCIDALITNFHLPKSSLFMLVCALMGREPMLKAYHHAIESGYGFYSYGDACLLIPNHD